MIDPGISPEPDAGGRAAPAPPAPVHLPDEEDSATYWSDTQVLEVLHDAHAAGRSLTRAIREHEDAPRSPNEEAPRRASVSERPRPSFFSSLKAMFRRRPK